MFTAIRIAVALIEVTVWLARVTFKVIMTIVGVTVVVILLAISEIDKAYMRYRYNR